MKPRLSKHERKALRFAYKLMRGDYQQQYLWYVHTTFAYGGDGSLTPRQEWIEPDAAEHKPYLSEDTLAALELQGYMECRQFPDGRWLYRLTREGCMVLGWDWPLEPPYAEIPRKKLLRILADSRNGDYTDYSFSGIDRADPAKGTHRRGYDPHDPNARYIRFRHR